MRRYLTLACFLTLAPLVQAGTVAWWRFERNFDSEVNTDQLRLAPAPGNEFSDSVPGAPILSAPDISVDNKSSFSNDLDKGAICDRSALIDQTILSSSFTIEAFVKLDRSGIEEGKEPTFQRIIGDAVNEEPGGWSLMIHEGKVRFFGFQASDGEVVSLMSEALVNDGAWHHVAVVGLRDGNVLTIQLCVDYSADPRIADIQGDSVTGRMISQLDRPYIVGGYNRFHGQIDELRISDKALSEGQFLKIPAAQP